MIIGKILGLLGLTLLVAFPAWAEEAYENNFDLAEDDMETEGQDVSTFHIRWWKPWMMMKMMKKVKWISLRKENLAGLDAIELRRDVDTYTSARDIVAIIEDTIAGTFAADSVFASNTYASTGEARDIEPIPIKSIIVSYINISNRSKI